MKVSNNGLELIMKFEGLSLKPYLCPAGIPTIGYGNTYYPTGRNVSMSDTPITKEFAVDMLRYIADKDFGYTINQNLNGLLNQNQFDALVSFAYNIGNGNLLKSTLFKKIHSKDYVGASNEFIKWNKAGGKVLKGLTARREAEKELFIRQ